MLPDEILDVIISFLTPDSRASLCRLCHISERKMKDMLIIRCRENKIPNSKLPIFTRGRNIYQFMRDETTFFCKRYESYIFRKWQEMYYISKNVQLIARTWCFISYRSLIIRSCSSLFRVHWSNFSQCRFSVFTIYNWFWAPLKMIFPVEILDIIASFITPSFRTSFYHHCETQKCIMKGLTRIKTREHRNRKERGLSTQGRSIYQFMRDKTWSVCKSHMLYAFRKWRDTHHISMKVQLIS